MDYLKLLRKGKRFEEMYEAIGDGLKTANRFNMTAKLKNMKGYLIWIQNPRELDDRRRWSKAANLWLDVIINYPTEYSTGIYVSIV